MQTLKRFSRLTKQERSLVVQAVLATSVIQLSLALVPVRTVQRLAAAIGWRSDEPFSADRIVWAVRSVARSVPGSTCLVQALAAQSLLMRHGYRPLLTIGVAKNECDRFGAHAWVVCDNEVLIGGHEAANYTALLNLES
jgi:transglutaminase superfamily protein